MGSGTNIKYLLLFTFFLFLCCLGIYQIKEKASLPFAVESFQKQLVVIKSNSEISKGYTLLSVNNHTFSSFEEIEVFIDGKRIGENVVISYKTPLSEETAVVSLVNYYSMLDVITYSVSGILFLLIGTLTLKKSSQKKSSKIFYWGCSGAALLITMTPGSYVILPGYLGFITRFVFHLAYCLTPVIFVHFILNFPNERKGKNPLILVISYIFGVLLSVILSYAFIQAVISNSTEQIARFIWIYENILRVFVIINFAWAVTGFIFSYKRISSTADRKKLKWILFGFLVGPLGYVLFWVLPYIIFGNGLLPEFLVIGFLGAVPATFAIAIVKYHFFDIDFIFNRSVVYLIVISSLLVLYMLLFAAASYFVEGIDDTIPTTISVLIVAFTLQPVKKKVQHFVDRKFFRIQYNYRVTLKKFLEEIDTCIDFQIMAEKVIIRTNEIIPVEKIGFFELQSTNKIKLIAQINFNLLLNRTITFKVAELKTSLPKPVALINQVEDGMDIEPADSRIFERWGMSLVFPLRSVQNEIFGFLVLGKKKSGLRFTVEDIDLLNAVSSKVATTMERNKYQRELIAEHLEKEKLAELNEMKSFFVSSVSHDLKTPITSIKIFTDILKSMNQSSEKALNYLNIIEGESNRLTRLIDNVLDYTRIEKGIKNYSLEKISLNDVIKESFEIMEYQIRMNKFELQTYYYNTEIFICADKDAVKEVILNLISNAIKYSGEQKKIFIKSSVQEKFASVEIRDTGIGISSEEMKNIFEPFFRSKYLTGKKIGGTGIGLSIVKHIMDAHNGQIKVKSELGKGSTFTLLFPIDEGS